MIQKGDVEGSQAGQLYQEPSSSGIDKLPSRLLKYAKAHKRALAMAGHLKGLQIGSEGPSGPVSCEEYEEARTASGKLCSCGSWLHFRHYFTVDELRLVGGDFCQLTKLCPLCAIRRASKTLARYLERFRLLMANSLEMNGVELKPYLITLTVKNGPDLLERMSHLKKAWKRLVDRRRQALSGNGRGKTCFRQVLAAVGSFEVTNRGRGWHPHMHMIALCDEEISRDILSREWQISTQDSFIVDISPIAYKSDEECAKAFCEVFKYSMKFQDLSLPLNWDAHRQLKRQRLTVSIGGFYGIEEVAETADDCSDLDQLPFADLFFRYLSDEAGYTYDRTREQVAAPAERPEGTPGSGGLLAVPAPSVELASLNCNGSPM